MTTPKAMTELERISWVLKLIDKDIAQLSPSKLAEYRKDLAVFLDVPVSPGVFVTCIKKGERCPEDLTIKELEEIQSNFKTIITEKVDDRLFLEFQSSPEQWSDPKSFAKKYRELKPKHTEATKFPLSTIETSLNPIWTKLRGFKNGLQVDEMQLSNEAIIRAIKIEESTPVRYVPSSFNRVFMVFYGTAKEMAILRLQLAINQETLGSIERCSCELCGHKIFFRTGKMIYCSLRCTRVMNRRRWRENKSHRLKEAEKAKERRERGKRKAHEKKRKQR